MTLTQAQDILIILSRQWPTAAVARYFARHPDGRVFGVAVENPTQLVSAAQWADSQGWNSYIQVNPSSQVTGSRSSASDIIAWSWFFVDLDPTGPNPELDEAESFVRSFLANYLGIINLHATVIDSGRGRQLWFPLGPTGTDEQIAVRTVPLPRQPDEEDLKANQRFLSIREAAPRAMSYWLGLLRDRMEQHGIQDVTVDTSVSDLPRVMRLPYTINTKTGKEARILLTNPGPNVTMGYKLIQYAPYRLWKEATVVPIGGGEWPEYLPRMTRAGRMFLSEGQQGEGGRHRAASAAMLSLLELGCPLDEVKAALRFGGQLCEPVLPATETDQMCERRRNAVK